MLAGKKTTNFNITELGSNPLGDNLHYPSAIEWSDCY